MQCKYAITFYYFFNDNKMDEGKAELNSYVLRFLLNVTLKAASR